MIQVDPMPDEIAVAHEGRIAWVNGCQTAGEFDHLLLQAIGKRRGGVDKKPRLDHLALVSGMSPSSYAHQHSLLPVWCFASDTGYLYGEQSAEITRVYGMTTRDTGAYCCVQCITEDMSHWPFSWFRRSHQLKGVDWCPVHGCRLSKVENSTPFTRTPNYWLNQSKLQQVRTCVDELPSSGFLRKYTDILTAFLQQARSFKLEVINLQIAGRVGELGACMRTVEDGQHRPISALIQKLAPTQWLVENFKDFSPKEGRFSRTVDLIANSINTGRKAHIYALALSALYDSSEAALTATYNPGLARRESRSGVSSSQKVSQGKNSSRLEKAFQRFRNGESICAASSAERVDPSKLETHLRNLTLDVSKYVAEA